MGQQRKADADVLFASIQTLGRVAHLERFPRDGFASITSARSSCSASPPPRNAPTGATFWPCARRTSPTAATSWRASSRTSSAASGTSASRTRWTTGTSPGATPASTRRSSPDTSPPSPGPETPSSSSRSAAGPAPWPSASPSATRTSWTSVPRAQSLDELSEGRLDVICAVDVFNEGLDLPELDTVLMLRPTESRILWLQQFGRGLRKKKDDKPLTVIDYIGNHRTFLLKPQTLFSLQPGGHEVLNLLERAREGPIEIAPGCSVTYELEAIDILRGLVKVTTDRQEALKRYYEEFAELHGARPRALEAFHEGYNPRAARAAHGSWLGFVKELGGLEAGQQVTLERHRPFLDELEDTPMTKSYKMLVLLGMLNEDAFPGEITIDTLAESVTALASRNRRLVADLGPKAATSDGLKHHLEQNPIEAWTGGKGTGGTPYFAYEDGVFRTTITTAPDDRPALQELARELAEWRLAEYVDRLERQPDG